MDGAPFWSFVARWGLRRFNLIRGTYSMLQASPAAFRARLRTYSSLRVLASIACSGIVAFSTALPSYAQQAQFSYSTQALGGGLYVPLGVAVDSQQNVYTTELFNSAVQEIP